MFKKTHRISVTTVDQVVTFIKINEMSFCYLNKSINTVWAKFVAMRYEAGLGPTCSYHCSVKS